MKRVSSAVDTVLIGLWSFLLMFFFFSALYMFVLPERWKSQLSTDIATKTSISILCWISTIQFSRYWNCTLWLPLALNSVIFLLYSATDALPGRLHCLTVAAISSWIIIFICMPIYVAVIPPHWKPRIKWSGKSGESWQAKRIQRELELRKMVPAAAVAATE